MKPLPCDPSPAASQGGACTDAVVAPCVHADDSTQAHAWTVQQHYDGRWELFRAMRAYSVPRLPQEVVTGDAAASCADRDTLRRVAHNLKTVLALLGLPMASRHAQALETLLARPRPAPGLEPEAAQAWGALRAWVQQAAGRAAAPAAGEDGPALS